MGWAPTEWFLGELEPSSPHAVGTAAYVDKALNNYAIICKSFYYPLFNCVLSSDTNFKPSNDSIYVKNKIHAFYKLLKVHQSNFNYPYLVLIPKFHKTPVRFWTVTVDYNTYSNNANKILLNVLKQIYNLF